MRTRNNYRKPRRIRKLCNRFLIITDGMITEQGYFERIKRLTRDDITIVARNKDIDKLVDLAIARKEKSDYDMVAVICDIDQRLQTKKSKDTLICAMSTARKNNIVMCMSHESFEIWLLAHLGRVKSNMKNRTLAHDACVKNHITKGHDGKEIVVEKINKQSIMAAITEAQRLRTVYGNDIITNSPLTDVDKIVSKINFN